MNGNTKKRPSAAQVERITNSIRKWMYTALYMDMSQELQRQRLTLNDERIVNGKVETQMLQATIGTARTKNGTEVAVFKLAAEPILYTYCKGKKQILTVPIALLDTAEAASNTEGLTAIREYLLQQIELMRNGHRDNHDLRGNRHRAAKGPQRRMAAARPNQGNSECVERPGIYYGLPRFKNRDGHNRGYNRV